jgi:hypothetical protein
VNWKISPVWSAYGEVGKLWDTSGAQRTSSSSVLGSVGLKARW